MYSVILYDLANDSNIAKFTYEERYDAEKKYSLMNDLLTSQNKKHNVYLILKENEKVIRDFYYC